MLFESDREFVWIEEIYLSFVIIKHSECTDNYLAKDGH